MHRFAQFFNSLLLLTFVQISVAATEPHDYFYVTHQFIFNSALKQQLKLTPEQARVWDEMEIAIEQARQETKQQYDVFNAVLEKETLQSMPSIDVIYSAKQILEQRILQVDKKVNVAKVNLYDSLTLDQQQIIEDRIFSDTSRTLETFKDHSLQDELNLNLRQRILWRNAFKDSQKIMMKMQRVLTHKDFSKRSNFHYKFVEQYHQLNILRLKLYLQLNTHQQTMLRQYWRQHHAQS